MDRCRIISRRGLRLRCSAILLAGALGLAGFSASAQTQLYADRKTYQVDFPAANRVFSDDEASAPAKTVDEQGRPILAPHPQPTSDIHTLEDLFQAKIEVEGADPLVAKTHLFGKPINLIPYADEDDIVDAAGNAVPRGDAAISAYFPPGEVGFAVKNHRPLHRTLKLDDDPEDLREEMKLQDTHIEIIVGVMRSGLPGVISCNSPQNYMDGLFGEADYPMIFVRPHFPDFLDAHTRKLFMENLRTMVVGFDAVAVFPNEYNGGDPLGARDPKHLREHVAMMIRGVAGDEDAKDFFKSDEHKIYCAELAFICSSAAMLVPLNDQGALSVLQEFGDSPERAKEVWTKFQEEVANHNAGRTSEFVELNDNRRVRLIKLADAAALKDLKPVLEYADARTRASMNNQLAFPPMTVADMVESFLKVYVPREQLGESVAATQAALLKKMGPGLIEAAAATESREAGAKLQLLLDQIVNVVGKQYSSYAEFRAALRPYMELAQRVTGPRSSDPSTGLFVPPTLFHLVTRGDRPGGLIGLDYVGHGLHYSMLKPADAAR